MSQPSGNETGTPDPLLLSREHRFLFVHIYKNAGISITTALMPFAATSNQLRLESWCNRAGLSYLSPRVIRPNSGVRDWLSNGMNNVYERMTFLPGHPQPVHDAHVTASEIIAKLGRETFDSYYSFGIVRNPWDWQVSLYRFALETVVRIAGPAAYLRGLGRERRTYAHLESFDDYIRWRCAEDVHLQKDFLFSDGGEQLVTSVGRFEHLVEDFRKICDEIGISVDLPRLNESSGGRRYEEYYTPETIELVRTAFATDIEQFGYEFG